MATQTTETEEIRGRSLGEGVRYVILIYYTMTSTVLKIDST